MPETMDKKSIAVCGINCIICSAFLSNKCGGCYGEESLKRKSCRNWNKRKCADEKGISYCYECSDFPCKYIKSLDKTYREKYDLKLMENNLYMKENGIEKFLNNEKISHICECGGIIDVHSKKCSE